MIYLRETTEIQNFTFIPKKMNATSIVLRNDSTNVEISENIEFFIEEYYLTASTVFDLKEGYFYDLTVLNGTEIVYLDKIFCTNQPLDTYTINKDTYTEVPSTNIIFYE